MSDIVKKISQLNKQKEPKDKSLVEELFPEEAKEKSPLPEESGITNLGTIGNPKIKMAPDGSLSGFQEINLGPGVAPTPPPAGRDWDTMFGGMREFSLDALGAPGENLNGPKAPPPQDPLEEERKRFIQIITSMLEEGRYEAAVNAILEMRKVVGMPEGR